VSQAMKPGDVLAGDLNAVAEQFRRGVRELGAVYLLSQCGEAGEGVEAVDASTSPAQQAGERELIERVRSAVQQLRKREAEVIRLFFFEHRNVTECGVALGVHKSQASRSLKKALRTLQCLLGDGVIPDG